ncbi:flagellar basal body P-ring formation chaperone FlgA [Aquipseudomonas guryensis]|jgi:flagella basal body P-ring formation protein FlgA|uniref:Flagella basal body P-ring formation protein FlgA n=1 Tax=Aquipseudomonas guryensis TaxID=2759165 RepID=A0A7W4H3G7_9GAMM|nr:flagellar basal body P-ring formation chaperone FlgA [Pseudomonas guryensis]MBB1519608.1 flagellar basal body P-ring formation protein FlgA [Pseudomonas guryensis]
MNAITTLSRRLMAKRRTLAGVLPALCLLGYSSLQAGSFTLPEELIGASEGFLEFTVEDYLERSEIQARYEIRINPLDPRLRLAACDSDLTQSLESPVQPVGRVTVRVSCEGSSPWTVFVPAQVRLFRPIVVATRPLKRDQVLGPADVSMIEQDIGPLSRGYLTDAAQAIGKKLTRPLQADQVLTPASLELAESIRRGDQVVITARSGTISVRMPGEALSDGVLGEQINIRNQRSQRTVRARVVGPGQVEVEM